MASDRFVHFHIERPSKGDLLKIVTNYLGGCGVIRSEPDRIFIDLPGSATSPFKGIPNARVLPFEMTDRWIEVIYQKTDGVWSVDVLTRQQDEFTCAIADQLARALSRFYQGELDME